MTTPALSTYQSVPPPNYKWRVVGMLWFCGFFNYADRQAIFSVFPLLELEMHLDKVQLGLLGSSFALVYGICAPFAGNIVDRIRRKTAVLGGLWAWSKSGVCTCAHAQYSVCPRSTRNWIQLKITTMMNRIQAAAEPSAIRRFTNADS